MKKNYDIEHLGNTQEQERILGISEQLLRINHNCMNNLLRSISNMEIQLKENKDYLLHNISRISKELDTPAVDEEKIETTILVADDDPIIREIITTFFSMQGFTVVSLSNGLEALQSFYYGKYDLVLTDINMPGINGNLLARHIKNICKTVPVVAITGSADRAGENFDEIICKPFHVDDLLHIVEEYLHNTKLAVETE